MIVCMKMKEFITNYLCFANFEDVKKDIFIPVGVNFKSDGSMRNVINGSPITISTDLLICWDINLYDKNDIRNDVTVKESLYNMCYYFDRDAIARKFMANMVKYSMKHPQQRIIILCPDDEAEKYNYLNFYREYFYARYGYPCIIGIGGGMKLQERDKFLLMETIVRPNKSYLKKVKEKVEEDLYEYHEYRAEKWKQYPNVRINDMRMMKRKQLYKECQYVINDLKDISYYDKEDLISLLSDYYGTGLSDEDVKQTSLYKELKAKGINIIL